MFWSKIWLFIVAAAAALALAVALLLPRPAERARALEERDRLVVACDVVNILLRDAARVQVEVAGVFARTPVVVTALEGANKLDAIDAKTAGDARKVAGDTIAAVAGARPDFAILIDERGRVLTRAGIDEDAFGDVMAGRFLVDDALAGQLRDDLWYVGGRLYRVAASPVVKGADYVGAVVIGSAISKQLAEDVVKPLGAKIGFYADSKLVVSSTADVLDQDLLQAYQPLAASRGELVDDCKARAPVLAHSGAAEYSAVVARLPGEARAANAFFGVYLERPKALGLMGTLDAVRKDDMSFANFPWVAVGLAFLLALGIGIALMILEADRPLRRLQADAVTLASDKSERLPEEHHGGRFGSIARSVNIKVDKQGRELRSAKRNLEQLLGPGGEDALDDAPAPAPQAPVKPPPPSEFKFSAPSPRPPLGGDGPAPLELAVTPRSPVSRPSAATPLATPAPAQMPAPVQSMVPPRAAPRGAIAMPPSTAPAAPVREQTPPPAALDDDILSMPTASLPAAPVAPAASGPLSTAPATLDDEDGGPADDDAYFRKVFDEFVALKRHCGEPTAGLTYPRFAEKLRRNRDDLMAKPGCIDVRFSVYVKDGKAALKATPVKET